MRETSPAAEIEREPANLGMVKSVRLEGASACASSWLACGAAARRFNPRAIGTPLAAVKLVESGVRKLRTRLTEDIVAYVVRRVWSKGKRTTFDFAFPLAANFHFPFVVTLTHS